MKNIQYDIHRDLIVQCQIGDRVAQNELYKRYAGAMYNICRRMMNDEDEAKDLLQEAFVEAFLKIHTLKELNTFSAWIKRITINKCINAIKKKRIFAISIDEDFEVRPYWPLRRRSTSKTSRFGLVGSVCRIFAHTHGSRS